MASFFWHDYETFGRVPRRDRPVQFAGLRTDLDLNETGEPVMAYCRPGPDQLPDPEAVLLTGITPQHALRHGVPEHAFAARIESELAAPGTIGVGYNSIRFDDEVTRHLFWRNLIDPYAREWSDGCGRWDLMDVVRCCWALRPEGIEWPVYRDGDLAGRPSFKLEHLTQANGLAHADAHDALADVRATLALARRVRERQPRLWQFCLKLHKKQAVWDEIGHGRPFLHLSGRYAIERGMLAVVWPLAPHPLNKNELIVWDLAHDPAELAALDADSARQRLFTRSDALPEGVKRLPIKTIHVNKSPIVIGNLAVAAAAEARFGLDRALALRHAEEAARVAPQVLPLWREVFTRPAASEPVDVDEALYDGFLGDADRGKLTRLRALSPEALAAQRPRFEDPRLDELLFRYRARNFPQTLAADERARWHAHCHGRLIEGAGGATTLASYFDHIDRLATDPAREADDRAQALLEALVDYGESIAPETAAHTPG
jgi:exodeoxyribonuclease-1